MTDYLDGGCCFGALMPVVDVPLAPGATSSVVAQLQKILNAAGFNAGQTDGVIGVQTLRAIDQAYAVLARSPSDYARQIASGGRPRTARQAIKDLSLAFIDHAGLTAPDRLAQQAAYVPPIASTATIKMGPVEALAFADTVGIGPGKKITDGISTAGWIAIGLGVFAAGSALVMALRRR